MTCGLYSVSWITTCNDRLPHNPCSFCESCFKSYNYIQGKKVGNFKAFSYPYDCDVASLQLKKPMKRLMTDDSVMA